MVRTIHGLTKAEALLEAGMINAFGGRATAFYDRDMGYRTRTALASRRHWGVQVMEEPNA